VSTVRQVEGDVLADLTWPDTGRLAADGGVLAIPIGSTEQHGPHLPLSTDTDIAVALCQRLARARDDVTIAPALAYGSSGEHAGFPGTLSIGQAALELLLVELCRSASDTFAHVLLVSAHGGNAGPVSRAADRLRNESKDVHVFFPRWEGDAHAGRSETSLQLALDPARVLLDRAVVGEVRQLAAIRDLLLAGGVKSVSPSGVLGDPTGANRAEGFALLDALSCSLLDEVTAWRSAVVS
jgi:mycofactocin system creatininase family protein